MRHQFRLSSFLNLIFSSFFGDNADGATSNSATAGKNLKTTPPEGKITESQCSLVFIYTQSCPYSMRASPYVSALARAFPQIPVIAIESGEYLQYRWNLRVFYTPKIKLFIGNHVYREFNGTDTSLDELTEFVWRNIRKLCLILRELLKNDLTNTWRNNGCLNERIDFCFKH